MKLLLVATLLAMVFQSSAADPDTRLFEMRTYYAAPGKMDELHARFRDHTVALFEKHGITNIGYWVPIENPDNKLVYVLAYPDHVQRDLRFKSFTSDPDWQAAQKASEANGKLVAKVDQLFLAATDFSPKIEPSLQKPDRVFELRTYTTTPGNLGALDERFRTHTTALFAKHGMTNLFYWHCTPPQSQADSTLVYLLAHASVEAAKTAFLDFRADPEWVTVKAASEQKAGGSLTVPDGVVSVFMKPTDYSPTR